MKYARYLAWFVITLLALSLSTPVLAQNFSVSPAEVKVDNLVPGQEAEFELIIHNREDVSHTFSLSSYNPKESQRREGRESLPDSSWVKFSPEEIEIAANSKARVRVKVMVPPDPKWLDKDWEIWLRVAPGEKDFLVINYYIRLLVATSSQIGSSPASEHSNTPFVIIGAATIVILLSYSIYYSRHKTS